MAKLMLLLSFCLLGLLSASQPTSLQAAEAEEERLDKVASFANAQFDYKFKRYISSCSAASETFKANCMEKGLTDKDCKITTCAYCNGSSSHQGDESSCGDAGSCVGHKADWHPDESSCQSQGTCTGEGNHSSIAQSEAACIGRGLCNVSEHETQDSCTKAGGNWTAATWIPATWVPATWTIVANVSDEAACRDVAGDLAVWQEQDAENNECCYEGRLECERDANGEELEFGCCDVCLNSSHPDYALSCVMDSMEGPSVCGTTQGSCHYCANFPGRDSEGWCQSSSSCSVSDIFDESSCKKANGTWTVGVWSLNETATNEKTCESQNYCAYCAGTSDHVSSEEDCKRLGSCTDSSKGEEWTCVNEGGVCSDANHSDAKETCIEMNGTWTPANWTPAAWTVVAAADEDSCEDSGEGRTWIKVQRYESGDALPAAPMAGDSCSTGPEHAEPSHILPDTCIDVDRFFKDAEEGKSVHDAMNGNCSVAGHANLTCSDYYDQIRQYMIMAPVVTNHANASERAAFTFTDKSCLVILKNAHNNGKLSMAGTNRTHVLLLNPTNYAGADEISFTGGNVAMLGGSSAGAVDVSSPGKIDIVDVNNEGPVTVTGSDDIFIARVHNRASAAITVSNASAVLVNVTNEGTVTVQGGGNYKAWKIVNKGLIRIEAGHIELELVCPSDGKVIMSEGVTGSVAYETGCRGNISVPSGVTEEEQGISTTTVSEKSNGSSTTTGNDESSDSSTTSTFSEKPTESKVTSFEASMNIANASKFDKDKFLLALAETMGVNTSSIEVESIDYEVKVGYSFSAPVTEAAAISAIANTTGVPESSVSVVLASTGARRLAVRRLSTSVTATIKTEDATEVDSIASKSDDASMLQQSLAAVGVEVTPVVTAAATKAVTVQTKVMAPGTEALEAPQAQQLSAAVSAELGVEVDASVSGVQVITVTNAPTSTQSVSETTTSSGPMPQDGDSMSGAIVPVPYVLWALCISATLAAW